MSYAAAFKEELQKRMAKQEQEEIDILISGHVDFPEYKYHCGLLRGMQIAVSLCEEIADDLNRA
jgi:hypothetical protein